MDKFSDPNAVPFAYATDSSGIVIRSPGIVEFTFLSERLAQAAPNNDPTTEAVVCARLALPIDRAARFSETLAAALAQHREPKPGSDRGVSRGEVAAGVLGAALQNVAGRLLDHIDPSL